MSKSSSRKAPAGPRPSLRERAADVGASAARVLRRKAKEPAASQSMPLAKMQADAVELSGLNISQLSNLFDVFEAIHHQWLAVGCQPFAKSHDPIVGVRPNAAGDLAEQEASRAALIRDRIADEARLRRPQDDWQRDEALSLRIKDEILCEGAIRDRDLLMKAVKAWG
ncbi:hypothetical protein [Methylobacterium sp. CM6246]